MDRKLVEALEFYADPSKYPAPLTGGLGDLWHDCGAVARAALASAESQSEWRDIASAPKDVGTYILLSLPAEVTPERVAFASWQGQGWYGVCSLGLTYRGEDKPLGWQPLPMPLPAPPPET